MRQTAQLQRQRNNLRMLGWESALWPTKKKEVSRFGRLMVSQTVKCQRITRLSPRWNGEVLWRDVGVGVGVG